MKTIPCKYGQCTTLYNVQHSVYIHFVHKDELKHSLSPLLNPI